MILYNVIVISLSVLGIGFVVMGLIQEKVIGHCLENILIQRGVLTVLVAISILLANRIGRYNPNVITIASDEFMNTLIAIVMLILYAMFVYPRDSHKPDTVGTLVVIIGLPVFTAMPYILTYALKILGLNI